MSTATPIENINYWRHPSLSGIELSQAEFTHFSFDKHVHLDYHLGVVTQGAQQFVNKGSSYQLGQHSLSTLNPDETHDGQSRDADGYRVKVMSIPVEYMNEVSQELGLKEHFFSAPMVDDPTLYQYFIQLHELLIQGQCSALAGESHLLNFIHLLLERYPSGVSSCITKPNQPQGLSKLQVSLVKQRIHDEPWHNTQLETLANEVSLSKFQFLRQFKQATGMTPHAYLKRVRLELAKKSLSHGALVADVAQQFGFFDQSHLNKAFKQAFLLSPVQFQRRML
ncbi:transcriptional regulator, AraC family [Shewanella baltica OS625]|uniref:AraC family transcriptional regulator n=1 Tax=Shewanella baltica TaxID=62322 RepID=UPI0001DB83D4|nr:AraC family transcriptional regulator [Shewanella baltica]ADT92898.1 transcriptional regulator, AraC family [Shewanella baltica OS678]EHC06016.1 transcriptional regulator, AraC family [Shewanella baltica OS625]